MEGTNHVNLMDWETTRGRRWAEWLRREVGLEVGKRGGHGCRRRMRGLKVGRRASICARDVDARALDFVGLLALSG